MLTGRATETILILDTYSNMPAAATHSRSTTSRGDPQQEHDHCRFRADHEAVEQESPAGRAPSDDGKVIIAPDARVAVRLGQARALPGESNALPDVVHVVRGVPELLEVVGQGGLGVFQISGVLRGAFGRLLRELRILRGAVARGAALRVVGVRRDRGERRAPCARCLGDGDE